MNKRHFDIALRCGFVLTMKEKDEEILKDQVIGISGNKITWIGAISEGGWEAAKIIDASTKIVMPGLINGHMHMSMNLFRGLADDLPFQEWLHNYILPLEGRLVSPEFVRLGSELAALESIQRGVTTVCDMYYYESDIADVVDRAGLRGILGETVADFPQPDDKQKQGKNFQIFEDMCGKYNHHSRIIPALAPHAVLMQL
jgi:5-methylthioadenosine/S-adenosylhomocysteine deaminase